jgi:hypothetical protein
MRMARYEGRFEVEGRGGVLLRLDRGLRRGRVWR